MKVSRSFAMPNKFTFRIPPVENLLERYGVLLGAWVDPMAGYYSPAKFTNDIDLHAPTWSHKDGFEFLSQFQSGVVEGVLFDPPYSLRQVTESYSGNGKDTIKVITKYKDKIAELVRVNGYVISAGWNSNGIGKIRGFEIKEVLLIAHGSEHNDTIITVEQKLESKK